MNKRFQIAGVVTTLLIGGVYYFSGMPEDQPIFMPDQALAAKFAMLSGGGNSSCSADFMQSIDAMPDRGRLQGSCCSSMDIHRYTEQVTGLQKYEDIIEIPSDPYDIDTGLAKKLRAYYDRELTLEEQRAYDYAMANAHEKGPCCCKCWRWYVYGGLGKLLIQKYHFTGEQVTEVWNLSDGCGGAEHGTDHGSKDTMMQ